MILSDLFFQPELYNTTQEQDFIIENTKIDVVVSKHYVKLFEIDSLETPISMHEIPQEKRLDIIQTYSLMKIRPFDEFIQNN